MAKVYLDSGDSFTLSNNNTTVYGAGGTEVLTIASGVTGLTFDSNCDRVALGGASSAYTYQQQGVNLVVYSGSTQVATIPLQTDSDGTQVTFTNGTVNAKIASGVMTFGGTTVVAGTSSSTATTLTASTIDTATTSSSTSSTSGSTSTSSLSVNTDNVVGTSGNDSIDASRIITSGVAYNSLNNADSINGGSGTDTLAIQMSETGDITPASISNVEVVTLEVLSSQAANARILTMSGSDAAVTTVTMANGAGTDGVMTTVSNLQSAITALNVQNSQRDHTVTVANTKLSGSSDSLAIGVSGVTGGAGQTISAGTVSSSSGYETMSITSSGTQTNTFTLDDGNGTSLATINVAGDRALTVTLVPTTVTKVDATSFTAALTLTPAANAQSMSIVGGTGDDILGVGGYTALDTINGGSGTDTLVITHAEATAATTTQSNVSGIEVIEFSAITSATAVTLSNFAATGARLFTGAHTANVNLNYAAGTNSFDRSASTDNANETTTLTVAGVATTDVMNVTLGSTAVASVWDGTGAFTITGAETVNVATQFGAATIGGALTITNSASVESVVITGQQALTITGLTTADVVNASGMTGSATLSMGGGGANSMTITGTSNADTLVGGTVADIISGGSGNDIIANAVSGANSAANDVLTGGAGYDTFRLVGSSASAAVYTGSAYISDFTVGTSTTATDILSIDVTTATYGTSKIAQGATDVALTATAVGSTTVTSVAQNAASAALGANTQLIKLTTGVAFTTDLQGTFNAAIGSAALTSATAASDYLFALYDTTNLRMVVGTVDPGGANTTIASADVVTLVGTINMTAADYANFGANNFNIVDY